VLCRASN